MMSIHSSLHHTQTHTHTHTRAALSMHATGRWGAFLARLLKKLECVFFLHVAAPAVSSTAKRAVSSTRSSGDDRGGDTRPGPRRHVYGLGAETLSRRRVTDDVFDMGVVRGRDRNSLSSLNLNLDL